MVAVRDLLAELGEATAGDVAGRFKGVQAVQAEKLLESLAAVGVAIEVRGAAVGVGAVERGQACSCRAETDEAPNAEGPSAERGSKRR